MPFIHRELFLRDGPPWGFRIYEDENRGLIVHKIRQWSCAFKAKLREGDIILAINRFSTKNVSHIEAVEMIENTIQGLFLLVGRHESMYNKKVNFDEHKGTVQDNSITKIVLNLKREPLTSPASPDLTPIPISKLMKEYDIPPRPECEAKKKRFANSEFFNDPNVYYPTLEEKIEMAKILAESLTAPVNLKSKGANMFEKQRQRIEKYVKEGPDPEPETDHVIQIILPDGTVKTLDPPDIAPPPPKPPNPSGGGRTDYNSNQYRIPPPPGAPKTLTEYLERIKKYPTVKHDAIGPEKCFTIASALHHGHDRGSNIFQKMRFRSQKWEISNFEVKQVIITKPISKYSNQPKPVSKLAMSERKPFNNLIEKNNVPCQTNVASSSPAQWRPVKFKVPAPI